MRAAGERGALDGMCKYLIALVSSWFLKYIIHNSLVEGIVAHSISLLHRLSRICL